MTCQHILTLQLDSLGDSYLEGTLQPPDVNIDSIVKAGSDGHQDASFVVSSSTSCFLKSLMY